MMLWNLNTFTPLYETILDLNNPDLSKQHVLQKMNRIRFLVEKCPDAIAQKPDSEGNTTPLHALVQTVYVFTD